MRKKRSGRGDRGNVDSSSDRGGVNGIVVVSVQHLVSLYGQPIPSSDCFGTLNLSFVSPSSISFLLILAVGFENGSSCQMQCDSGIE